MTETPHPIDKIRHRRLTWRDMPGGCEIMKKLNFCLFRRGKYTPGENLHHRPARRYKTADIQAQEKRRIIEALATSRSVSAACRKASVPKNTHNYYMRTDPGYALHIRKFLGK